MALIKCPECGREISDKAPACPHCGYPLEKSNVNQEKIESKDSELKQETSVPETIKSEKKKIPILPICIIAVIVVAIVAGGLYYNKVQTEKRIAEEKRQEAIQYNEYVDNFRQFGFMAESGELLSYDLLDNITKIWYNCIYEEDSYFTDQYTKDSNGNFYDDFNTALMMYMWSDSYSSDEEDIENCQKKVAEYYSKLKNAPEDFEKCTDKAAAVQSAFTSLVDFSLNVEGNYKSVVDTAREKKDDFDKAYTDFKLAIPDKKEIEEEAEDSYDFRKVNFGMSCDDVIQSEKDNYNIDTEYSWHSCDIDDTEIGDGLKGKITYYFDKYRYLDGIWTTFDKSVSQDQLTELLKKMYGDDFDEKSMTISRKNDYKTIKVEIESGDDDISLDFYRVEDEKEESENDTEENSADNVEDSTEE